MAIPHITPEQVAQYGVVASPDRLTGKPADNKAVFDRLVRELVTAAVNNVIDQTNALLLTEAERTTNENGRTAAETSRVNAETLRVAAEKARVNAEKARATAEDARALAEKSRTDNETARKAAETARVDAETARVAAEVLRVEAEKARATAETARANEEKTRGTAETARVTAEGTRKTQEDARQTAEQGRATNEAGRGTAEQNRAAAELLRVGAENTRSGAEEARKTAETNRALAEDGRGTAETARTGAEEARKTAENERAERDAADAVCEAYQPTHDYIVGNKALYIGSTYRCIKPCRGVVPTTAANWMVFAEKGADGKGSGDMLASVYDGTGKRQDVFEFAEKKKKEAITESATDAKAKADTAEKNAKAASRPVNWTPSAAEVGAASAKHGHQITDVANLESSLSNKADTGFLISPDLNDVKASGIYRFNTPKNGPDFNYGQLLVMGFDHGNGDTCFQLATDTIRDKISFRRGSTLGGASPTWTNWTGIATATPPIPYALPTISGLESCGESSYFKTQENIVVVKFKLKPTLAQVSAGAVIATLPVGYKPVFYVESPIFVRLSDGTMTSGTVGVDVNGSVILYNCSAPVGSEIIGSVPPYIAAN